MLNNPLRHTYLRNCRHSIFLVDWFCLIFRRRSGIGISNIHKIYVCMSVIQFKGFSTKVEKSVFGSENSCYFLLLMWKCEICINEVKPYFNWIGFNISLKPCKFNLCCAHMKEMQSIDSIHNHIYSYCDDKSFIWLASNYYRDVLSVVVT